MGIFNRRAVKTPKEYSFEEAVEKLKESGEFTLECGDFEKLHCRGCINTCRLSHARCDMGRRVAAAIEKQLACCQEE